jgi:hypothetical protein
VVGLRRTGANQHARALIKRIGSQKFEFARFIAAHTQPGQVVALDEQLRSPSKRVRPVSFR